MSVVDAALFDDTPLIGRVWWGTDDGVPAASGTGPAVVELGRISLQADVAMPPARHTAPFTVLRSVTVAISSVMVVGPVELSETVKRCRDTGLLAWIARQLLPGDHMRMPAAVNGGQRVVGDRVNAAPTRSVLSFVPLALTATLAKLEVRLTRRPDAGGETQLHWLRCAVRGAKLAASSPGVASSTVATAPLSTLVEVACLDVTASGCDMPLLAVDGIHVQMAATVTPPATITPLSASPTVACLAASLAPGVVAEWVSFVAPMLSMLRAAHPAPAPPAHPHMGSGSARGPLRSRARDTATAGAVASARRPNLAAQGVQLKVATVSLAVVLAKSDREACASSVGGTWVWSPADSEWGVVPGAASDAQAALLALTVDNFTINFAAGQSPEFGRSVSVAAEHLRVWVPAVHPNAETPRLVAPVRWRGSDIAGVATLPGLRECLANSSEAWSHCVHLEWFAVSVAGACRSSGWGAIRTDMLPGDVIVWRVRS